MLIARCRLGRHRERWVWFVDSANTAGGIQMPDPQLEHVATIKAQLGGDAFRFTSPLGRRHIAEVGDITMEGDGIKAQRVGKSAADWLTIAEDGTWGALDVRFTLQTDDDVYVYVEYGGRIDFATGRAVSAPTFQCGDPKYDWLDREQFVAIGRVDRETSVLTYEMYRVA